jgi:cell volume regulation protein A
LVSRPIAVLICLLPFRYPLRETGYIAAVGLRGAVPIILATLPVMSGAPRGTEIFNIVFFTVIANALMPGIIVGRLAHWLRVAANEPPPPPALLEITSSEMLEGGEFVSFFVEAVSAVAGSTVAELPLPSNCTAVLLIRGHTIIAPRGETRIAAGDHVYLLCRPEDRPFIDLIFGRRESD